MVKWEGGRFKDGGRKVNPRFHLLVLFIKGAKGHDGFKIFFLIASAKFWN